eukprot:3144563-Amphidinium_carterae.1
MSRGSGAVAIMTVTGFIHVYFQTSDLHGLSSLELPCSQNIARLRRRSTDNVNHFSSGVANFHD